MQEVINKREKYNKNLNLFRIIKLNLV
jgi:hypothetical protein